ncbi:MAG: hypothetical protein AAF441_10575 [Pseudomonadota bacterium]
MEQQFWDFRASDCTQVALFAVFGLTTAGAMALVSTLPGASIAVWPAMLFLGLAFIFAGLIYVAVRLAAGGDDYYYEEETSPSKLISVCFICVFGTVGGLSASYALSKNVALMALGTVHCSYYGTCSPGENPHRTSRSSLDASKDRRLSEARPEVGGLSVTRARSQPPPPNRTQRELALASGQKPARGMTVQPQQPVKRQHVRQTVAYVYELSAPTREIRTMRTGSAVFKASPVFVQAAKTLVAQQKQNVRSVTTVAYRQDQPYSGRTDEPASARNNTSGVQRFVRTNAQNTSDVTKTAALLNTRSTAIPVSQGGPVLPDPGVQHRTEHSPVAASVTARDNSHSAVIDHAEETLKETNTLLQETGSLLSDIDVVYDDPLLGDISVDRSEFRKKRRESSQRTAPVRKPSNAGPIQTAPENPAASLAESLRRAKEKIAAAKAKAKIQPAPRPRKKVLGKSVRKPRSASTSNVASTGEQARPSVSLGAPLRIVAVAFAGPTDAPQGKSGGHAFSPNVQSGGQSTCDLGTSQRAFGRCA